MCSRGECLVASVRVICAGFAGGCIGPGSDEKSFLGECLDAVEVGHGIVDFEPTCRGMVRGWTGGEEEAPFYEGIGFEVGGACCASIIQGQHELTAKRVL